MDPAYLTWIGVAAIGAVLGLFFRPRTLGLVCVAAFAIAVAGIFVGYGTKNENLGFLSGMAAMAIPVLGVMLAAGAAIVRKVFKRGPKE